MHNKNNKKTFGFSLIELMIAIAIIAILTSVATPVYLSYTVKSTVSSAIPILESLKNKASDFYTSNNTFPKDTDINTSPYTDSMINITTVEVKATFTGITGSTLGNVQVKYNSAAPVPVPLQGKILSLVAIDNTNAIIWKCVTGDSNGTTTTKIDPMYLPSACK